VGKSSVAIAIATLHQRLDDNQVADMFIDTENRSLAAIVDEILDRTGW
jgi:hypothetical protein